MRRTRYHKIQSGSVYVTGHSPGNGTGNDYATIKYNSAGVEQWVSRYSLLQTAGSDFSKSIAVDNSGNAYVTGYCEGGQTGKDIVTIKYNSSGDSVWVEIFNTPGVGTNDYANALVIDTLGNVYVSGSRFTPGTTTSDNYLTIKYNSVGLQLWAADYDGPANSIDVASSIAVDGNGNVYVTGLSYGNLSGSPSDYATVKYNSSGIQQWVARYEGPANGNDIPHAIAVDDSGNVFVTGESVDVNGSTPDYATIKYNSLGVEKWVSRYVGIQSNSGDGAASLAIDNLGNVYVTGTSGSFGGTKADYATVKYNSLGVQQWAERYNGPPGNGSDKAKSIVLDNFGNVYVTGSSAGSGTSDDFATIKYSQTPTGIDQTDYSLPEKHSLHQNYPNPFNPSTTIRYGLTQQMLVTLKIYNILGQEVATLVNEEKPAGIYEVGFNASQLSSGIYFYKLQAGSFVETKKMILIK